PSFFEILREIRRSNSRKSYLIAVWFLLTRGWVMPSPTDLLLMASCGLIAAIGLTLLTYAYRVAPSSSVAPFEYSFMFWGLLWGWLFWDSIPDSLAWVGIAVIIGAGMIVIRAQPQKEKAAPEGTA
ncbi:MAG: DMT family transporter, partial [Tabrizicola sp.]|nr:DMT family transporter [Tabrizicola sp.]